MKSNCYGESGASSKLVDRRDEPSEALLRLSQILAPDGPLPMSKSTWWAGVRSGRYPKPVKLGPRITAWRKSDIETLVDGGAG